jgi:hypothetical protein
MRSPLVVVNEPGVSRRIRPIVSTTSIPPPPTRVPQAGGLCNSSLTGSKLDADPLYWGESCTPKHRQSGQSGQASRPALKNRRFVRQMVAYGITRDKIAGVIGVSEDTLLKHYKPEIELGAAQAITLVANSLFKMATTAPYNVRVAAAIFYLKTRAQWRETVSHEILRPVSEMTDEEIKARLGIEEIGNVVAFPRKSRHPRARHRHPAAGECRQPRAPHTDLP